jgi:amino acid transporter
MILAQAAVAVVISIVLGFALGSPANAFGFLGAVVVILFVPIYGLSAVSCFFYYYRKQRSEFNVILHGVIPIAALLAFLPILLAALGIDFAGLGIAPLTGAAQYAPEIAIGWIVIGVIVYFVMRRARPQSMKQLDHIFIDEAVEQHLTEPVKA